jgi:proline iminopeptidase
MAIVYFTGRDRLLRSSSTLPFATINGTELFYIGTGTGIPCLVMHGGLGVDHTYLHPWLDPLGDRFRLVYYDHRGNGRSGRPALSTLTLSQLAADADALRYHLDVEQVAVLGHSFGGIVALEYALVYPHRLSHLILIGTTAAFDYGDEIVAKIQHKRPPREVLAAWGQPPADDADNAEMLRFLKARAPLYFVRHDPALVDRLFGRTVFSATASKRGSELVEGYSRVPRLGEIETPTLVLTGREDFIAPPSQAERLGRGMPHAQVVIFEQSGHYPYVEEPDAFFAALRNWFGNLSGR